jgi:hypothetical protein
MAFLKLDKIVFVIAGKDDRKPLMTAPETRDPQRTATDGNGVSSLRG